MNKHITILEDDLDIREICTLLFTEEGYQVNGFSDIASFTAANTCPDIFLLDIRLPDGDGRHVCNALKADPRFAKVPIIMMSAHQDRAGVMAGCKADEFISKPFNLDHMLKCISDFVA